MDDPAKREAFRQALLVAQIFWPRVRLMEEILAFLLEEARPRVMQEGNADRISRLSDLQRRVWETYQRPGSRELDEQMRGLLENPPSP